MYEIYQRLLDEKGLKNADIARATGISNMTLSDWKRGKSTPKIDKLQKIASFFNVTTEYLMGNEKENEIADTLLEAYDSGLASDVQFKKLMEYYKLLYQADKDMILNIAKRCAENKADN